MYRHHIRLLLLILLFAAQISSAQPYCRVRTFNVRDGLPSNNISGISQDGRGLIWTATWNGLCYYDGYNFRSFRSSEESGWLSTNCMVALRHNSDDNIWVKTYDQQLYLFDTDRTRFVNVGDVISEKVGHEFQTRYIYPLEDGHTWVIGRDDQIAVRICDRAPTDADSLIVINPNDKSGRGVLHEVRNDKEGREWFFFSDHIELAGTPVNAIGHFEYMTSAGDATYFATQRGVLYSYRGETNTLNSLRSATETASINCMTALDENTLLLGSNDGIYVYDCRKGKSKVISTGAPGSPSANITDLYVDSYKRIWAFTSADGIMMVDAGSLKALPVSTSDDTRAGTGSRKPLWVEDQFGTVWLVPRNGVFGYYDEDTGTIVGYPLQTLHFGFDNVPEIESFFIDSGNNLWLSTYHDLMLINFKRPVVTRVPLIKNQETRALLAKDDGKVWAGTSDGIIGEFDHSGHFLNYIGIGRGGVITRSSSLVRFADKICALYEDSHGVVWVGTQGEGLYVIAPDGKTDRYCYDKSARYSINCNAVFAFDEDEKGNMWVATYGGGVNLALYDNRNNINFIHASNELESYPIEEFGNVRHLTHDGLGNIIVSSSAGLIVFSNKFTDPSKIRFNVTRQNRGKDAFLRTGYVMQSLITGSGKIIVSTRGGDVQSVKESNILKPGLSFNPFGPHGNKAVPDLAEGIVLSMIEDYDGNICVVSDASMTLYNPETERIISLGPNELGENIEFTEAQPTMNARTGHLLLPTVGGLISFSSENLVQSSFNPQIIFTNVMFQGSDENISIFGNRLDVPSDKRNLSIEFAALDYAADRNISYAYMLEGYDEDWVYVGASNFARLNNLGPGHQRLLVKSTNGDGVWSDNVTALDIFVKPTFWETPLAKLLYLVIAVFMIVVIVHVYELRRKNAMHQEIDDMKTKFFTDMSHKLRTPLTLIGGPAYEVLNSDTPLSDTDRRHLQTVLHNTDNMLGLVNKMLRWSHDQGVYISDENVVSVASLEDINEYPVEQKYDADAQIVENSKDVKLLIVEDNDELRQFLCDILLTNYKVESAANGREGLERAEQWQPDFIITDVMMPEMDGLTMVSLIKQNNALSHIPIIVLSAKASVADRVHGLQMGIDDYITKPFSASYLKQRIANIILQRRSLQQRYLELLGSHKPVDMGSDAGVDIQPKDYRLQSPSITDSDQEMMTQLLAFLETRIEDEDLKIDELAEAVNLGRTAFYGKIKSLVGMSPSDFLRHIRMQRAAELIARSKLNFSQIAFRVGFSDPKYFTKCFKKETGMTPSEYRANKKAVENETVFTDE